MKKSILLTAALVMATTAANAQPFVEGVPFSARQFGKHLVPTLDAQAQPSKLRAEKKSNYYLRPEGALFQASDKKGQIWGTVYMYVPGAYDVKFKKQGTDAYVWHQNTFDYYGDVTVNDCSSKTDYYYNIGANGDFTMKSLFDGRDALPTLVCNTDSFLLASENPYFGNAGDPGKHESLALKFYYPRLYSGIDQDNRRVAPLSYTMDQVSEVFFGGMDNKYAYGSGTFTQGDAKYTATSVYQYFDKPMAPLVVEDIFIPVISKGYYPIAKGKQLRLQIHDVMEQDGKRIPGEKILYELTATEPETIDVGSIPYDDNTSYNAFTLVFTKKNAEGKAERFVIDQPFYVVIDGLDKEGIDCGFEISELPYYYNDFDSAVGIWKKDGSPAFFSLYKDVALKVSFSAWYDYCNPMYYVFNGREENYGIVKMDNDGTSGTTLIPGDLVFAGPAIKTNQSWFDANNEPNYTVTCDADWVKSITPDTKTWAEYDITVLKLECDPLPEGVSGRKCELHVQSKTCKSTYPIEVLQGDATAGINGVTVNVARDGKTYNLSGQRVAPDTKGIVIRDGKKYVNK